MTITEAGREEVNLKKLECESICCTEEICFSQVWRTLFDQSSSILSPVSDDATDCMSISSSSKVLVNSVLAVGLSTNSVMRTEGSLMDSDELDVLDDACDSLKQDIRRRMQSMIEVGIAYDGADGSTMKYADCDDLSTVGSLGSCFNSVTDKLPLL